MVLDLKLCRFENASWGFRLTGGADFDVPLTVVKVAEGSLAEQAGMRVGDVIVRINDEPACNMSHNDAHEVIMHCGNNFFLGVLREEEDEPNIHENNNIEENHSPRPELYTPDSILESSGKSPVSEIVETPMKFPVRAIPVVADEEKATEDEIADVMSGEAEVLKEHNVIGVNFNRIFPKAGICQSSEVFRTLNEEAVKTKIEREKDKRKWTTFLQRPDRPIPKSKQQLEEEARIPYKVHIVRQPKPRVAPDRIPTPPREIPEPEPEPPVAEVPEETEPEPPPTDSEVPNLEPMCNENGTENMDEALNGLDAEFEEIHDQIETEEQIEEPVVVEIQKTQEELLLEKQLVDVQKQLMALSSLPSTIQATLDSVTKQLAELLPNFRLQPSPNVEVQEIVEETIVEEENNNCVQNDEEIAEIFANETTITETHVETSEFNEESIREHIYNEQHFEEEIIHEPIEIPKREPTVQELKQLEAQREQQRLEEELNYKKQKELVRLELEHRQRLIRERTSKRPPKAFGPLTPQERPLILPGGRRWRQPKDAFNDEFIAETLSSQAELITGTTLGVNFLKYQKPEKHIDLEKSEVYKVIHHLERQPRRGIEIRPAKVLAEADVRSCATPISCG